MAVFRDEIIVLKSKKFSESDKILTLFGKRRGKFSAIAKGIRKLTSKKRGHLETFSMAKVACAEGKSLDLVVEVESYFNLDSNKVSLDQFRRLGFVALVFDRFIPEGVPEAKLFDAFERYISGNYSVSDTSSIVVQVLDHLGFVSNEARDKWVAQSESEENLREIQRWVQKILDTI